MSAASLAEFQSTLPYGSDIALVHIVRTLLISIHAPLRERLIATLPIKALPRISIHAPLRERLQQAGRFFSCQYFNPRSLTGATIQSATRVFKENNFNPRSLTGATSAAELWTQQSVFQSTLPYGSDARMTGAVLQKQISIHAPLRERLLAHFTLPLTQEFQSTLPYGSDSIKTKYFSIHLNQAFIANRLNSNPQRFYFDVRKLLVSHSSSSCEPKLILCSI